MAYSRSSFKSKYGTTGTTAPRKTYTKKTPVAKVAHKAIATPSPQQENIFSLIVQTFNVIIEAVAGAGKTSTIVEFLHRHPRCRAIFLAFNKSIATELETKVPDWAVAKTLHALGYGAIAKARRSRLDFSEKKVFWHAADVIGVQDGRKGHSLSEIERKVNNCKREWANFAAKVISLAKATLIYPDALPAQYAALLAEYDLEQPKTLDFNPIETIQRIYSDTIEMPSIDFDDMIFLPNYLGLALPAFDLVLVDESQDLNAAQMGMLKLFLKSNPKTRFVFVGDPSQAIYGFRGAGTNSMELIREGFAATEAGLSVSFRCAKAIVAEAQKYVSHIESHPDAPEGIVRNLEDMDTFYSEAGQDFVLCRKNAPLVAVCLAFLARGKAATIVGRAVAENLKALINKLSKDNGAMALADLYSAIGNWEQKEIAKANARNNERMAEEIADKAACIYALGEGLSTVAELLANLDRIFYQNEKDEDGKWFKGTKLMTFHKSKGLENDRVYILPTNPIRTNLDWQEQQETNLHYVSVTRAKKELVYLPNPEAKK